MEARRTVSLKAPAEKEEKPVNYPGEGLIIFPFNKSATNQSEERSDSVPATPATTSPESTA